MANLSKMKCVPCMGGVPPLKGSELNKLQKELGHDWKVVKQHHVEKDYKFKDFKQTLGFVNKIGKIAEEQGHHPNIEFTYGKAKISIYTHKINGLTVSDFVLAAKIEKIKRG